MSTRTIDVAAFFDLDGTLLSVNSGTLWIRRERRLGRLSRRQYAEALAYLIAYKLNTIDMVAAMRKALSTVKGQPEAELREWTHRWYLDEVAPLVAPGGRHALHDHRLAGHRLVLLTSSSPYEAEIACRHLALDDFLCSRYEVEGGVLTGEPLLPLCYGPGKVTYAERYARLHGIDLDRSYFYTDSASDIPMLARVGYPRVVNPDPPLALAARRRGWTRLDWRRTP